MLRLLGRHNAFNVRKVLWLLDELELPVVQENWGRGFRSTDDAEFLALNPLGTVPVLVDGPAVIRESYVILRYLAAREGAAALYPTVLAERACVEAWMVWVAYEMSMPMRGAYLGGELGLAPWNRASFVQLGRAEYAKCMGQLDAALRAASYLAGATFTLADIPAGFVVHRWFAMTSVERTPLPALEAYYARLSERPAFRRHIRNGLP